MVEQEKSEGMTAPNPETKIRVLETTLVELGFDTTFDNLNFGYNKFTLGVKKVGKDTIYVGLLNHGLAGGHLAQFLNNVSPFGDQDRQGILDDIELPIRADHDYKRGKTAKNSEYVFLHERHLSDPRTKDSYERFAEDHADSWVSALEFEDGSEVFDRARRIRFVNDREDVRKELFSEDGNFLGDVDDVDEIFRLADAIRYHSVFKIRFEDFCRENGLTQCSKDYQPFIKTLLSKTEQEEFAFAYFVANNRDIFVDLDTQRIIGEDSMRNRNGAYTKFGDNGRDIVIDNGRGTKLILSPTGQNNDRFSWKAVEYQFPYGYDKFSLLPLIAWKIDGNGTRNFLTQQEAMPLVRELGLPEGEQGDTKLGEITVASFARHIIKNWPKAMSLKPLEGFLSRIRNDEIFKQQMGGAQMPAWVGVERHRDELLNGKISPLSIIESNLALAA